MMPKIPRTGTYVKPRGRSMYSRDDSPNRIDFVLDGVARSVSYRPGESLLEVLRDRCGVTTLKDGCRPQGQCGACLAIVNGEAQVTCTLDVEEIAGGTITTLAGLSEDERSRLVQAFSQSVADTSCGYCLPSIALHAAAVVREHPDPTRQEIAQALDGHLCRCSGYSGFVRAFEEFARGEHCKEDSCKVDDAAAARVLGDKQFVADLTRPGLLHAAVLLSPHARAKIKSIDTSVAAHVPGVVAVMTAADVPGERHQGLIEQDWPIFIAVGEYTRCVGDVIAVVAAEDLATAREAANLVLVEYEVFEPVVDPASALAPHAPRINPRHDNLLGKYVVKRGDAEDELACSAHLARGVFTTQRIEHLFLEPECALAELLPDGRLCVHSQGQRVLDEQRQIAAALGWSRDRVVVRQVPNGGALGGKEDLTIQAHAALLAWKTGRPVKLPLDREQSIRIHPKRHPMRLEYEVGCDVEGHITAVRARIVADGGAYASVGAHVLERAVAHAAGVYHVPNVDAEAIAVYTNNPPSGAMDGFGVPQVMFALESCIDDLAEMTGVDRWEIRYRNAVRMGDPLTTGDVLEQSVGITRCLLAVKSAWDEATDQGRAVGIACGIQSGRVSRGASNENGGMVPHAFAVQLVLLDEAGQVAKVVAAQNIARAADPILCQEQIEGAVHMGLGYALTEELVCKNGMPVTFQMRDLGALRARDLPEVDVLLVKGSGPDEFVASKSMDEIALVPTAAAVASALRAGDGNQRRDLPMRDSTAAKAMSVGLPFILARAARPRRVYIHRGASR